MPPSYTLLAKLAVEAIAGGAPSAAGKLAGTRKRLQGFGCGPQKSLEARALFTLGAYGRD